MALAKTIKNNVEMSWEKVRLGDVCEVLGGYAFKSEDYKSSGIPLLRISNINDNEISFNDEAIYIESTKLKNLDKFKVVFNDILIALSGATTGKFGVYKLNSEAYLNQRVGLIRATEKMNQKYLLHYFNILKSQIFQIAQGAAQPNISTGQIEELLIPLPPLATQKRIADILDTADALRRKDQELLTKYDQLAQAIFIDMFGDPVKNEKGWEVKKLGEVTKIKGGKRLPIGDKLITKNTGFPYIKAGNIKRGKVTLNDLEYLFPETQKKIKNYIVQTGDVCVTIVGANIGDVGIVPIELNGANLTENAAKIIVNDPEKINNVYIANFWSMPFIQKEIQKRSMAVGVPKLALFRIEEIEILIPPIELQIKYNNIVNVINHNVFNLGKNNSHSTSLFSSLIQQAFNGTLVS